MAIKMNFLSGKSRFTAETRDSSLVVSVKVNDTEHFDARQLEYVAANFSYGILKPAVINEKKIEYSGPQSVSLRNFMMNPQAAPDRNLFSSMVGQIADAGRKISAANLRPGNLMMDPDTVFINAMTGELWFIYLPGIRAEGSGDFFGLLHWLTGQFIAVGGQDKSYLYEFQRMLNDQQMQQLQQVANFASEGRGKAGWQNTAADAFVKETIPADDDDDDVTTLLEDTDETTLFNQIEPAHCATLLRCKTRDIIRIDKAVFRIGKERGYVDYCVTDNPTVSRSHADILSRQGRYFIVDLNSKNRTVINNRVLQPNIEVEIRDGDIIMLANEEFEFRI